MERVKNVAVERGDNWFAARRIRQMVIRRSRTFIRRIALLSICRKGFFPLGTLHSVRHLSMHLLGDLTKKRRIAFLRLGRRQFVGMGDYIRMSAPIAGAVNDLLVLGKGTSNSCYRSVKKNFCHNVRQSSRTDRPLGLLDRSAVRTLAEPPNWEPCTTRCQIFEVCCTRISSMPERTIGS